MNILMDIGHPAHVHFFNSIYRLLKDKHTFFFTCREIPIVISLLDHYRIPYQVIGTKGNGLVGKMVKQIAFTKEIRRILIDESIDIACGVSTVHATKGTKAKSIVFCDDDSIVIKFFAKYVLPYADCVLSPSALSSEARKNTVYYPGQHELSYLNPRRFHPNPSFMKSVGIEKEEPYFVVRFSAYKAHHDINEGGMSIQQKRALVDALQKYGKVFISSELPVEDEFEENRLPIPVHDIHNFMYYAIMTVSDSQTMSSESALLGTPSFRCNSFSGRLSIIDELEKIYSLTHSFKTEQFDWMIRRIVIELELGNIKERYRTHLKLFHEDKIDVAAFWAWFIDNYPTSRIETKKGGFDYGAFQVPACDFTEG